MSSAVESAFSKMNPRERTLVGALIGLVVLLIVAGGTYWVRSSLAEKEAHIQRNKKAWAQIQKLAGPYLAREASKKHLIEQIEGNRYSLNPDNPVADLAVKTKVRYMSGATEEQASLSKLLQTVGEVKPKGLIPRRNNEVGPQVYRMSKEFQMKSGYAFTEDIYNFLAAAERVDPLIFITKLHIIRHGQKVDYVQVKNLTASTLRYVAKEGKGKGK